MKRKREEIKHCKKCGKVLVKWNKSGYCTNCGGYFRRKKYKEKVKREKRCLVCGGKVNPIITYPNGLNSIRLVRYPTKCYKCRIKQKVFKAKNTSLNVNEARYKK